MATPASSAPRPGEGSADHGSHAPATRVAGELIAVTGRDDFLLELGDALGGQLSLSPVEQLAAALEQLAHARRPQLLAIDARNSAELRADVDRAHAQAASVPIIVFAPAETEKSVSSSLKGSSLFAVLPIPVDRRKTTAVLEGALAEAVQRRASRGASPASPASATSAPVEHRFDLRAPLIAEPAALPAMTDTLTVDTPPQRRPLWAAIAGVVLIGIAFGAWRLWPRATVQVEVPVAHSTTPARPTAPNTAAPVAPGRTTAQAPPARATSGELPLIHGNVDDLLEKARLAMRERRFTEPANDSALLYYRSALGVDAANAEARDGMTRLANLLLTRFEESLTASRLDDAASALAGVKVTLPGDARLPPMESRLIAAEVSKDLADGNLEHVPTLIRQAQQDGVASTEQVGRWRTELARHQDDAHVKRVVDLISERIRDGHLEDPENDSAKYYLAQLKEIDASNPAVARSTHELIGAYLHKARDATLANHASEADHWQSAARAAGATPAELAAYSREIASTRQRAAGSEIDHLAQLARERLRDGHLTDPTQDSAAYYLGQLHDGYPDNSALAPLGRDLAAQLLERAMSEARAGLPAQMESDLSLARRWGADPAQLQAVEQASAAVSRTSAASGAPGTAAAPASPKRTRYVAPDYPAYAVDAHISGWVDLEFTVDAKGVPRKLRVTESHPRGIFDRAATDAVARWRFEPVIVDGTPKEVPAHEIIRFELPSQ